jgi:DNA-binding response OmpR family regulator
MAECQPVSIPYVMIVESDQELATMLQEALKHELKAGTIFAPTMNDALNIARALCPVLFLINTHLLGGDGLTLVDQLRQNKILASVPVLLLTTDLHNNQKLAEESGITCLPIPIELDYLFSVLMQHLPVNGVGEEEKRREQRKLHP